MTDRELLEFAAKAAGIDIVWARGDSAVTIVSENGQKRWEIWNPLKFNDDAFELAVKLKFAINVWDGCTVMTDGGLDATCVMEDISADPYAATRRAIVRAAAEIGKARP